MKYNVVRPRPVRRPLPAVKDPEITGSLALVTARMRLAGAVLAGTRGLGVGAAVALLFVGLSRLWPWESALAWAIVAVLAGGPLAALVAWLWPRDAWQAARVADRAGLRERVTTALEQSGLAPEERSPLSGAQRVDALARLRALDVKASVKVAPDLRVLRVAGALLLAAVVVLVLPNPIQATLDRRAVVKEEIKKQQDKIEEISKELAQKPLSEEDRRKLEKALTELAKRLDKAKDLDRALEALGKAEQELGELAQESAGATDLTGLAEALSKASMTAEAGHKALQGDPAGAKSALQSLAGKLQSLSKEGRDKLAEALERAAQAAPGSSTAGKLAASSAALKGGDAAGAGQALSEAGGALAGEMQQNAAASATGQAQSAVGSARRALTSANSSVASGSTGQSGSGSSRQSGSGQSGSGSGQSGSGSGSGQSGSGQGSSGSGISSGSSGTGGGSGASSSGSSNGQASGGSTGTGTSAGHGQALGGEGQYEQIFDPTRLGGDTDSSYVSGRPGSEPSDTFNTDPTQGQTSALAPYNEVYSSYAAQAQEVIDRTAIPESVKDVVRQYFLSINPGR